jgi:AraC-like DNA-binding protein
MKTIEVARTGIAQSQLPARIALPASLGTGFFARENDRSGLQLRTVRAKFNEVTELKYNSAGFSAGIGFSLSGSFESKSACFKNAIHSRPGMSAVFFYPGITDISMTVGCNAMAHSAIVMDEETMLRLMRNAACNSLSVTKKMEKGEPFFIPDALTPAMRMTFNQINQCAYTGPIREIFLEGKFLELLAYKLHQLYSGKSHIRQPPTLTPSEVERIRFAAELLTRDLDDPPDIANIARTVGLSRSTLYRNFSKVFNTSPWDYLRSQKLEAARQLLESGQANVTEVAYRVGYSNLSHFAKAFKTTFGILPSDIAIKPN